MRRQALAHLEEVSKLSMEKSSKFLNNAILTRKELNKHIFKIYFDDNPKLFSANGPTKENVFKSLGYCELLISGDTIELFDGDSMIINETWLLTIFNSIDKRSPTLKMFVISILGLLSYGKSTNLNALFTYKFAVLLIGCDYCFWNKIYLIIGTSDLTIINVLSESMKKLTEIM
ncbi:hypothetical protein C2G38_2168482 [Gigaspora rosea]|uniref:VLIG-type G domain-containing protein n=1 Tax=Gigaspora rosea TaxID=44941 RepID=A0A397VRA7_9GLOM|nr:hypothetical protein C2G38_2168482 [Gigaspora rosea]